MDENSISFIYGRHASVEALKNKSEINKIFIQKGINEKYRSEILKYTNNNKIIIQEVPKNKLDELTDNGNHQGIVLSVAAYKYAVLEDILNNAKKKDENPFILILDSIEDPHNLGSILRTADAAGVHGIIIPKRRSALLTNTVAKISTGAIEYIPVVRVTNLTRSVTELKEKGFWIYGTDMNGTDYRKWDANVPVALIIGNEGKGISTLLKKQVDEMLTIPMIGHVQSLNASVAASLLIYQGFNSRHKL